MRTALDYRSVSREVRFAVYRADNSGVADHVTLASRVENWPDDSFMASLKLLGG